METGEQYGVRIQAVWREAAPGQYARTPDPEGFSPVGRARRGMDHGTASQTSRAPCQPKAPRRRLSDSPRPGAGPNSPYSPNS